MFEEFKKFALKGNVVDMAVGIIIGAAFGKIVSTFVKEVVSPPLGLMVGGVDFTQLKIVLKEAQGSAAEVAIGYGQFLQVIFDFTIVAFAIFLAIKLLNQLQEKEAQKPVAPPKEQVLLEEIRDILKRQS